MTKDHFSKIYDAHMTEIYRFFYLRTNVREHSEELASEAFFKFWEHNKDKPEDYIKNARAFLYRISRNLLTDYIRKNNQNKQEISLEEFNDSPNLPRTLIDDNFRQSVELEEQQRKVKIALSKINPLYADVIVYYYIEGLTSEEIALVLEKTEGNVRVIVHRALESLKKEISNIQS
jgi:RNA polymerase sigma-70 factor (ECF subfamily)